MSNMKYYDADKFELKFENDTSIAERDYYAQRYKNVKSVASERNHCTSCSIHIGTSPSAEYNLKMHSVLRVTQCGKCYRFYNSSTFPKGDDGNEIHCRWCGQGGKLYCCSACPYVFCQKCIVRNLTSDALKLILSKDDWKCYACEPKILYPLRARHWALVNFIKEQIKSLEKKMARGLSDPDLIAFHMKKESSNCCRSKKTSQKPPAAFDDEDELPLWSKRDQSAGGIKTEIVENERPRRKIRKTQTYEPEPSVSAQKYKAKSKRTSRSISNATSTTAAANSNTAANVERIPCKREIITFIPGRALGQKYSSSANIMTPDEQEQSTFTNVIQQQSTELMTCPSTSVGRGRTQLQNQMFKAMQMCRQVDEKLIELMHSKTYKAANSMNDINELYTCLSHLLTYTNDRVQHLKGNCMDDMRQFGFANYVTDAMDSTDSCENNVTDSMDASIEENHHPLDENEIGECNIKTDPADTVYSIDVSNTKIDDFTSEFTIKNEPSD